MRVVHELPDHRDDDLRHRDREEIRQPDERRAPASARFRRSAEPKARNHSGSATPNMYLAETQKDW